MKPWVVSLFSLVLAAQSGPGLSRASQAGRSAALSGDRADILAAHRELVEAARAGEEVTFAQAVNGLAAFHSSASEDREASKVVHTEFDRAFSSGSAAWVRAMLLENGTGVSLTEVQREAVWRKLFTLAAPSDFASLNRARLALKDLRELLLYNGKGDEVTAMVEQEVRSAANQEDRAAGLMALWQHHADLGRMKAAKALESAIADFARLNDPNPSMELTWLWGSVATIWKASGRNSDAEAILKRAQEATRRG